MVHSVVRNVAAEYSAFDFFEKRSKIIKLLYIFKELLLEKEMFSTLKEYFEEYNFNLRFFFLFKL